MFQNKRHFENEEQENPRQPAAKSFIKTNYEGFEGMNYEQLRQPFTPRSASDERTRVNGRSESPEQKK